MIRSYEEILKDELKSPGSAYYDGTIYDGEVGSIFEAAKLYAIEIIKECSRRSKVEFIDDGHMRTGYYIVDNSDIKNLINDLK